MIVRVTEEHIRDGKMGACPSCYYCPIARAMKDDTGTFWSIREEEAERFRVIRPAGPSPPGMARVQPPERSRQVVQLPSAATDFIRRFDAGFPVHAFEFEIEWEPEAAHA